MWHKEVFENKQRKDINFDMISLEYDDIIDYKIKFIYERLWTTKSHQLCGPTIKTYQNQSDIKETHV